MDQASSAVIACLQKRITELDQAYATLQRDHLTVQIMARNALRALCQQRQPIQPEGFWIRANHVPYLREHFDAFNKPIKPTNIDGSTWVWQKFPKVLKRNLPVFSRTLLRWTKKQLQEYAVVPFQHALPIELFEAIVAHADRQTISRVARTSVRCYQLSMPLLLERVCVPDEKRLKQIFTSPEGAPLRALRLDFAQSFRHIRTVYITVSSIRRLSSTFALDVTRLPAGCETLPLHELAILIDMRRTPTSGPFLNILPSQSQAFLSCFNPRKLVVSVSPDNFDDPAMTHVVSKYAALAMSRWSRLRDVMVVDVNLLASLGETEDEITDASDGGWFLSRRGEHTESPEKVSIVWNISMYVLSTPKLGYNDFLDLLLHRDDTLRQPWVKSFTVIVRTKEIGDAFQKLIDASEEEVPSCLRWEVMKPVSGFSLVRSDGHLDVDCQIFQLDACLCHYSGPLSLRKRR